MVPVLSDHAWGMVSLFGRTCLLKKLSKVTLDIYLNYERKESCRRIFSLTHVHILRDGDKERKETLSLIRFLRVLTMVYVEFLDSPLSSFLKTREHNVSETGSVSVFIRERRHLLSRSPFGLDQQTFTVIS
jgi:hypothetical protein